MVFKKVSWMTHPSKDVLVQSGGSCILTSLAALAWHEIAVQLAFFFLDETKRIGINVDQAEDEKSQTNDEKARQPRELFGN